MLPIQSICTPLPPGLAATLACIYEATARKPGNVHSGASFEDLTTYSAFVTSAIVIGPIIEKARVAGVGQTVLAAVWASREAVGTNTNLGTLLLLAPLAFSQPNTRLQTAIGNVLEELGPDDTRPVYEAIRIAKAGGLGQQDVADVAADPPSTLTLGQAMALAADRDLIARQYTTNFNDVFRIATIVEVALDLGSGLEAAIVQAYLNQLAAVPDSLIQRKCGLATAEEASVRAKEVLRCGVPEDDNYQRAFADFDRWLRGDANRRNPGTTADLIAAALFVLLREGRLNWSVW